MPTVLTQPNLETYAERAAEALYAEAPDVQPAAITNFAIITHLATPLPPGIAEYELELIHVGQDVYGSMVNNREKLWPGYATALYREVAHAELPLWLPNDRAWRRLGRLAASSFELARNFNPNDLELSEALLAGDRRIIRYPDQPVY